MTANQPAFQDQIPENYCWGCGPLNPHGLHIKSRWSASGDEAICVWHPGQWHMAGPQHILNGGIIATIIDCHCICTAIADAYRREERSLSSAPLIWYVTGGLDVSYLRPSPIDRPVELRARLDEIKGKKTVVSCSLQSDGEECATARLVAIRVPPEWRERHGAPAAH
jgi:acyl-coenzyme A thioesterase PaaI-like protein